MKKIFVIICVAFTLSCNSEKNIKGEFKVTGQIKNAPDQNVYLEQVYFSDKAPDVIDTQKLVNGKFTVTGIAPEQGMYRVRLQNGGAYIFINDADNIPAAVDAKGQDLFSADFATPANRSLVKFLHLLDSMQTRLKEAGAQAAQPKQPGAADSAAQQSQTDITAMTQAYQQFIFNFVDTTRSPVMALFALGYTQGADPVLMDKALVGVNKRFPEHAALNNIIAEYKQAQAQAAGKPASLQDAMAPEIVLPDTEGKMFSLSSLRGKYVLVDFWASWCGPCREENPNVVTAYNRFKDKNFTILGVSLDKEKTQWINAIKDDGLAWKHVSDLKFWSSAVVPLYNIDGIPYNVLIDPKGKIIATSLRGMELQNKLAELLK